MVGRAAERVYDCLMKPTKFNSGYKGIRMYLVEEEPSEKPVINTFLGVQ